LSRRPDRRAVAVAVLVLAVLLLAGVAARGPAIISGPGAVRPVNDEPFRVPQPAQATRSPENTPSRDRQDSRTPPPSPVAGYLVLVLLGLVAAAALAALARSLWAYRSGVGARRRPARAAAPANRPAAESLAQAAREALTEVDQPAARDAVVRSWLLLGAAAAHAGLPAGESETATEYATRLQTEVGLPGPQLRRLAGLYHEARFSSHEIGESERGEARRLLIELTDDLAGART
jgi:Domain of unknown function (DUF4129)